MGNFAALNPLPVPWRIGPTLGATTLTADQTTVIYRAPVEQEVTDGGYAVSDTNVSASATNFATVSLLNAGAAGAGTSSIATVGGTGVAWTAGTPKVMTLTSTVATAQLDPGDYVAVKYDEDGTLTLHRFHGSFSVIAGHTA